MPDITAAIRQTLTNLPPPKQPLTNGETQQKQTSPDNQTYICISAWATKIVRMSRTEESCDFFSLSTNFQIISPVLNGWKSLLGTLPHVAVTKHPMNFWVRWPKWTSWCCLTLKNLLICRVARRFTMVHKGRPLRSQPLFSLQDFLLTLRLQLERTVTRPFLNPWVWSLQNSQEIQSQSCCQFVVSSGLIFWCPLRSAVQSFHHNDPYSRKQLRPTQLCDHSECVHEEE